MKQIALDKPIVFINYKGDAYVSSLRKRIIRYHFKGRKMPLPFAIQQFNKLQTGAVFEVSHLLTNQNRVFSALW